MKAKKSRGAKNKLYSERNQGRQVSDFPSDFRCNKNIFTFILQISRNEWLLTFVLNAKKCLDVKKETLSSTYLLITEITLTEVMEMVELYQELEKATAARWKSIFYVHYNFRAQDYCDD